MDAYDQGTEIPYRESLMKSIDLNQLYRELGFSAKTIPKDAKEYYKGINCKDWHGETVLIADIIIRKGGEKKHRIMVKCPNCPRFVFFGRLPQHIGASTCDGSAPKRVNRSRFPAWKGMKPC
jgi:hypothetical protein